MTAVYQNAPALAVAKFPAVVYDVRYFLNDDGSVWWVGKDVAKVLGYKDTDQAIRDHVDDEDKELFKPVDLTGLKIPNRGLTFINESGLYSLILSSKLPQAKKFKRWVTSEVLPSLRKNGYYKVESVKEEEKVESVEVEEVPIFMNVPADDFETEKFVAEIWNWLTNAVDSYDLSSSEQLVLFHWVRLFYKHFLNPVDISLNVLSKKIGRDPRTVRRAIVKLTQKKLFPPPFVMSDLLFDKEF